MKVTSVSGDLAFKEEYYNYYFLSDGKTVSHMRKEQPKFLQVKGDAYIVNVADGYDPHVFILAAIALDRIFYTKR